jgi:hypothetical protein
MANRTEHRGDTERRRTPLASAAILLGLYVALYLAVAGVMRLLDVMPAADSPPVDDAGVTPLLAASPPATEGAARQLHEDIHVREH